MCFLCGVLYSARCACYRDVMFVLSFGLGYYRGLFLLVFSLFLYFSVIFDVIVGSKSVVGLDSFWEVWLFDFWFEYGEPGCALW